MSEQAWIENLAFSDGVIARESERRTLYAHALAHTFADEVVRSVKSGLTLTDAVLAESCLLRERERNDDSVLQQILSLCDMIAFAGEVARRLTQERICSPSGFSFLDMAEPTEHAERISLVRNRYSDLAFDLFAKGFASPRVVASHSLRDTCEEVSGGYSDYCILPIYNEEDGRLRVPFSLMLQYELRICEAVDLPAKEDEGMTRYALLSRGIVEKAYRDPILLIRVETASPERLSNILQAVSAYGLTLSDLYSEKSTYGWHSLLSISVKGGDASALLLYLLLFYDGFQALGYYEEKREKQ